MFGGEFVLIAGAGGLALLFVLLLVVGALLRRRPSPHLNYGRVVGPGDDISRACSRCGHVTRAFDNCCPQCGANLSRPKRRGCLVPFLLVVVLLFLTTALVGLVVAFSGIQLKQDPAMEILSLEGEWESTRIEQSQMAVDLTMQVSNLAIKGSPGEDRLIATYDVRFDENAIERISLSEELAWNEFDNCFDGKRSVEDYVQHYRLEFLGDGVWKGETISDHNGESAETPSNDTDSDRVSIVVRKLDDNEFHYQMIGASGESLLFQFNRR